MRQSVETLLRPLRLDWTTIRRRIGSGFALKRRAAERAPDFELALKGAIVPRCPAPADRARQERPDHARAHGGTSAPRRPSGACDPARVELARFFFLFLFFDVESAR